MTLREALTTACSQLYDDPGLRPEALAEATCLLLHVLNISHASLLTTYDRVLTSGEVDAYFATITRRLANEPVQYITGLREFYGLPLTVTPAVLIPRNLTEHLVEAVLAELTSRDQSGEALRIVDVGTGSGAIAIALAVHLPRAQITALDLSTQALEVAARNTETNHVHARIRLLHSDLLSAIAHSGELPFDAIASNPPYVAVTDRRSLAPQVRDYEPPVALFAGDEGLDIYRRLIPQAFAALKQGGLLALEFGPGQQIAIAALLEGWHGLRLIEDFDRTPRIALARKP